MNSVILNKTYSQPPFCEKEILRYAGCKKATEEVEALVRECMNEAAPRLKYNVCYRVLDVLTEAGSCSFECFCLKSEKLAANLKGCGKAVVFAATVGVGIDRLIAKYSSISPAKALMFQAIGAERIEALCDVFCDDIRQEYGTELRPRFSPGYGDLGLESQKNIFSVLDCERRLGITLNGSLLMSPSKSVTAIAGMGSKKQDRT